MANAGARCAVTSYLTLPIPPIQTPLHSANIAWSLIQSLASIGFRSSIMHFTDTIADLRNRFFFILLVAAETRFERR